jgi:hypothetical protein
MHLILLANIVPRQVPGPPTHSPTSHCLGQSGWSVKLITQCRGRDYMNIYAIIRPRSEELGHKNNVTTKQINFFVAYRKSQLFGLCLSLRSTEISGPHSYIA